MKFIKQLVQCLTLIPGICFLAHIVANPNDSFWYSVVGGTLIGIYIMLSD